VAEVELATVPGLGGLLVRGAARSGRLAIASWLGREVGGLPDVSYLARGVRADPERLTAYQHLVGESASDALPAGFVHVLAFGVATALMVRADFPLPLAGLVHLANKVEQFQPLTCDDALEVRTCARGLRAHRSGTQVDLVTEVRAVGGDAGGGGNDGDGGTGEGTDAELAWRGTSTYLARGVGPPLLNPPGPDVSDPAHTRARARSDTWVPTGRWQLAGDLGRRYGAVSGDRNPIHLSALTARALGFPRAIAHGMYTASRALASVGAARTDAFTWTVEFAKPVLLPGTVLVRIAPDDDAGGFAYQGWSPGSGTVHFTGTVIPR